MEIDKKVIIKNQLDYISVAEAGKEKGVSRQAINYQLDNDHLDYFKPSVQKLVVKNRKYKNYSANKYNGKR